MMMMRGRILLTAVLVIAIDLTLEPLAARAVPITPLGEAPLSSSGDVVTDVVSSGDHTGGTTTDLREVVVDTGFFHPSGCQDKNGVFHETGSRWNFGCDRVCECVPTPEGPIRHCSAPNCAIPMLSPGCQLVRNPNRNESAGENCCDVVECQPVQCVDNNGGKHDVYTSWIDGELDCFCQYNYQDDTVQSSCILMQPETPPTPAPAPNEIQFPEEREWKREGLVNETNTTFDVCKDKQQNTYSVGQTWRDSCESECMCLQRGEAAVAECSPFPCPVPALLPGCTVVPNPNRDSVNSLNCCDKVVCPHKQCIGLDRFLYDLNAIWPENGQMCTCLLNYNVHQAVKKCGTEEEIKNL